MPKGGKGGGISCTCVKDNITKENQEFEATGIGGFDYKLFEDEEGGGVRQGLDGYHYLKHLIQLWPWYWVNHTEKMNEAVGENNSFDKSVGEEMVSSSFYKERFLEMYWVYYILGCGIKGTHIWVTTETSVSNKGRHKLHRYVRGNKYLLRVRCYLYRPHHFYACC